MQEGFRLFKMRLCIKDRFFLESCASVTIVSKNTVSVSDVSVVNLILGFCKFACSIFMSRKEKHRLCRSSKLLV